MTCLKLTTCSKITNLTASLARKNGMFYLFIYIQILQVLYVQCKNKVSQQAEYHNHFSLMGFLTLLACVRCTQTSLTWVLTQH